jgi:WhiB family redox-sensing transcriptional regulator
MPMDDTVADITARMFVRADWMADAACKGHDINLFFPQRGSSAAKANRICATCPVSSQCGNYAIDQGIRFGVWGATSERQRGRVRRERGGVQTPVIIAQCGSTGAFHRHRKNGEEPCDACWVAYRAANAERRIKDRQRKNGGRAA